MLRTTSNRTSAPAGRMPAANRAALSAWSDPSVATRADIPGARAGPCGADSTSAWLITPPFELGHSEPSGSFVPEQKGGSHGQPPWGCQAGWTLIRVRVARRPRARELDGQPP